MPLFISLSLNLLSREGPALEVEVNIVIHFLSRIKITLQNRQAHFQKELVACYTPIYAGQRVTCFGRDKGWSMQSLDSRSSPALEDFARRH